MAQANNTNPAGATVLDGVANMADTVRAAMFADGCAFYEGEHALIAFVHAFQPTMATVTNEPGDFARFYTMSLAWRVGYDAAKRNVSTDDILARGGVSDASGDAFQRRFKQATSEDVMGSDRLIGERPKSQKPDAQRKAAERAAHAERIAKLGEGKSPLEIQQAAAKEAAKIEAAKIEAAKAAEKAAAAKDPAAAARAAAAVKAARDAAVEAAKRADDLRQAADAATKARLAKAEEIARERIRQLKDQLRELMKDADADALARAIAAIKTKPAGKVAKSDKPAKPAK